MSQFLYVPGMWNYGNSSVRIAGLVGGWGMAVRKPLSKNGGSTTQRHCDGWRTLLTKPASNPTTRLHQALPGRHLGPRVDRIGRDVRLMPAGHVKRYVKRDDAVNAEAICKAVARPIMKLVEIKSAEQQSGLMPHRTRELLV